jgi:hypothetical protein
MKHYDARMSGDEFLNVFYMGDIPNVIPAKDECEFPEKFQLATLRTRAKSFSLFPNPLLCLHFPRKSQTNPQAYRSRTSNAEFS